MAFYYESKDKSKGKILDDLALELIGEWDRKTQGQNSPFYGEETEEKKYNLKMAGKVQNRIANYFPSIEKMLPVDSKELTGNSPEIIKRRSQYKNAARKMWKFLNKLFIPPSLLEAIADTPSVPKKSKRFKQVFETLQVTAKNTRLNTQELYPSLEELLRTTKSFPDLELVVSKYNAFFSNAEAIPRYTNAVASLVQSGWKTSVLVDIVRSTFGLSEHDGYVPVMGDLMSSMPKQDVKLLMAELELLTELDLDIEQQAHEESKMGDLIISDQGKRKLALSGFTLSIDRYGLFLGLAGRLGADYAFNEKASEAVLTESALSKKVAGGTCLVFNDGDSRISIELDAWGDIEISGIPLEDLDEYLLDLQEVGNFVQSTYNAIDMLGTLPHGKRHINASYGSKKSAVHYISGSVEILLDGINLQERSIKKLEARVKSEEKLRLYEELLLLEEMVDFEFIAAKTNDGVEIEMTLKGQPMAVEKECLQELLTTLDNYTSFQAEGRQCSFVDVLSYVNSNVTRQNIPQLLSYGRDTLQRVGSLFVQPQTFERNFDRLHYAEQQVAVEFLYSLRELNPELTDAQEWLSENHRDLVIDKGLDSV